MDMGFYIEELQGCKDDGNVQVMARERIGDLRRLVIEKIGLLAAETYEG
jgi:hypothetical protein